MVKVSTADHFSEVVKPILIVDILTLSQEIMSDRKIRNS